MIYKSVKESNPATMRCSVIICIILLCNLFTQNIKAQSLSIPGDTIFLNMEAEVQIFFPTAPKKVEIIPDEEQYYAWNSGPGINIITRAESFKPAILSVSEAERNHRFVLIYKKEIPNEEAKLYYDYSTVKKLERHINQTPFHKLLQPEQQRNNIVSAAPMVNYTDYIVFIEKGDSALLLQNYEEAKVNFEKAHILRPDELVPVQKLDEIKIKLAEKENLTQEQKEKQYFVLSAEAKTYLDQKKYDEARKAYKNVLKIRPGDAYATRQLETISNAVAELSRQREQQKNNELYKEYVAEGEQSINKNELAAARTAYEQALTIKQNDALAINRLKFIDDKEKQLREKEEFENRYNLIIESADKLLAAGDLDNAKSEYNRALTLSKRSWPQEQIKKIDKLILEKIARENLERQKLAQKLLEEKKEQERQVVENNYNSIILSGDNYFKAGNYDNAKKEYNRALTMFKRDYPRDQINSINKIISDQIAQENAEKKRLAQESQIAVRYTSLLNNAEAEFDKSNYTKAKAIYSEASGLKPVEEYPKERLLIIENILNKINEDQKAKIDSISSIKDVNQKYAEALSNGKLSYQKNDLLNAKLFYEEAKTLKPSEKEAANQLNIIDSKIEEMAIQTEIDNKYDEKIHLADSLIIAKIYEPSIVAYNEASAIKPMESYPKKQVKYIYYELEKRDNRKKEEAERRYMDALARADEAVTNKEYESAKSAYTEALSIHPENEYARRRLEIISYQIEKAKAEKINVEPVKEIPSKKSKRKKAVITRNK